MECPFCEYKILLKINMFCQETHTLTQKKEQKERKIEMYSWREYLLLCANSIICFHAAFEIMDLKQRILLLSLKAISQCCYLFKLTKHFFPFLFFCNIICSMFLFSFSSQKCIVTLMYKATMLFIVIFPIF